MTAIKKWWKTRTIIQKGLTILFIFIIISMQRGGPAMAAGAGGQSAYISYHALGWFLFGAFMTFAFLKKVNAEHYNRSDLIKNAVKKWFSSYVIVSAVLVLGWAFDFVAKTTIFANLFTLFVAWGVFWWLSKRPAGGRADPVNEGPRQANIPQPASIPTGTRVGMGKYAGPAPRPPREAAPRPGAARNKEPN